MDAAQRFSSILYREKIFKLGREEICLKTGRIAFPPKKSTLKGLSLLQWEYIHTFKRQTNPVAQKVKCWPTDLEVPGSSQLEVKSSKP